MASSDKALLAPTNVAYNDMHIGSHSNIVTQLIDSMIRACFNKFITNSPILRNYDAMKVNLGERKTVHYAILDTFGYFAEIVTVYLITSYFDQYKHNIDTTRLDIYTSEIPVYSSDDQILAKCIKDELNSIEYLEKLYGDIKVKDSNFVKDIFEDQELTSEAIGIMKNPPNLSKDNY